MVALVVETADAVTDEITSDTGVGGALLTVMLTGAEVATVPAVSRASAANTWVPLATVAVSHVIV
jgi:hypothetical protein